MTSCSNLVFRQLEHVDGQHLCFIPLQTVSTFFFETFIEDAVEIVTSLMPEGSSSPTLEVSHRSTQCVVALADPLSIALTGNDISLLPLLARAIINGLVLTLDMGEAYAAHADGKRVGYLIFSKPGQLLFSTQVCVVFMPLF